MRRALACGALFLLAALAAPSVHAQSATGPALPDPKKCVVVVDAAGEVGLRIADAQAAHEVLMVALRKRVGSDGVVYEGMRKSAEQMKRLLGSSAETTIQDSQLAYFDAAAKTAPWRVRVRFGTKKGQHFVTATCRKSTGTPDKPLETRTATGKNFLEAKDALAKDIATFCPAIASSSSTSGTMELPIEGSGPPPAGEVTGLAKKKPLKPWTAPPRRE
ncbi:MAG: hypothetical protein Q8O67_00515 [Deltaproteobacteria bacterium]|nr:hypothetical protein [Deltaproteobacteria bacterium]